MESVLDYQVPPEQFTPLAHFDGSVIVERTAGEVSARCHDEEANQLALNLMHDVVTVKKDVQQARDYYAKEFADFRRKEPTPYMNELQFESGSDTPDPDQRVLSDQDLEKAEQEGKQKEGKQKEGGPKGSSLALRMGADLRVRELVARGRASR